jgi:hypothetical protein
MKKKDHWAHTTKHKCEKKDNKLTSTWKERRLFKHNYVLYLISLFFFIFYFFAHVLFNRKKEKMKKKSKWEKWKNKSHHKCLLSVVYVAKEDSPTLFSVTCSSTSSFNIFLSFFILFSLQFSGKALNAHEINFHHSRVTHHYFSLVKI